MKTELKKLSDGNLDQITINSEINYEKISKIFLDNLLFIDK